MVLYFVSLTNSLFTVVFSAVVAISQLDLNLNYKLFNVLLYYSKLEKSAGSDQYLIFVT
ncbi:hypothetical protein SAMN05444372_108163 [Flavobacterium micromati]|uniref:Uncharacterized protein n=1 Tax=Flavobacterium micromati TaxID=229205 RepID=A0A1M5LQ98_9FLAO|nr:hypothetical protein SAMN05444372_108163 [Flavobacterium micromati]